MADSQKRSYTLYIDNTEAERALKKFQKTASDLEKEIDNIQKSGGDATKQMQALGNTQAQIKTLEASLKGGLSKSLRDLQNDVKRVESALKRATDPDVIRQLNTQLEGARRNLLQYEAGVLKVGRAQKQLAAESRGWFGSVKDFVVGSFLGGGLLGIVQTAITGVVSFFKDAKDAAIEADKAVTMFEATMDNLGKGDASGRFEEFARRIKDDLEFLDDEDLLGVFNQLQTYGKLTEQQIRELTPVIVDFAAKQQVSLETAASQIIKALEGSAKGLKEYGINIKEAGSDTERYNVIMTELKSKVDGAAHAFEESAAGPVAEQQQKIADLKEEIGEGLLPAYHGVLAVSSELIEFCREFNHMLGNGYVLLRQQTAGVIELQNTLSRFDKDNELNLSIIQQFASESIEMQEKRVAQNKALYESSKAQVEMLEREGRARGEIYTQAVAQMIQDKNILEQTRQILGANKQEQTDRQAQEAREKAEKEAEKRREAAQNKQERDAERLAAFLKKTAQDIAGFNLSEYEKEIAAVQHKYAEFERLAKKGSEAEIMLARQKAAEIAAINKKEADELAKTFKEQQQQIFLLRQEKSAAARKELNDLLKNSRDAARALATGLEKSVQGLDTAELINADLKVRKAGLFQRLSAEKEYLTKRHDQELKALKNSFEAGEILYGEYQALRQEEDFNFQEASYQAEVAHYSRLLDIASSFASAALNIFDSYSAERKKQEDAELERDKKDNEQKKRALKLQLDGKLLSRQQYDDRIATLDKSLEEKERAYRIRQFKREKASNIVKAVMGTAQAVVQALTAGPIIGPILAAIAGAMGAAQIGIIASQQPPEFGKGGKLKGPAHKSKTNGLPVTNPETGRVEAYLEGDEGILKKSAMRSGRVYTVTGTPSEITSSLNQRYGGASWDRPAAVTPAFSRYQPRQVDVPALTRSIGRVRLFENGGVFQPAGAGAPPLPVPPSATVDPELKAMIAENTRAVSTLQATLATGVKAVVYLNQLNEQQSRLDDLYDETTFRA